MLIHGYLVILCQPLALPKLIQKSKSVVGLLMVRQYLVKELVLEVEKIEIYVTQWQTS